jgi:hypothetical protein
LGTAVNVASPGKRRVDWGWHARMFGLSIVGAAGIVVLIAVIMLLCLAFGVLHFDDR